MCPFVPVSNVTMEECVECSCEFGRRLASELEVPVYLYEEAQQKDYRKSLAQIRHGQYEKLPTRVGLPVEKSATAINFTSKMLILRGIFYTVERPRVGPRFWTSRVCSKLGGKCDWSEEVSHCIQRQSIGYETAGSPHCT